MQLCSCGAGQLRGGVANGGMSVLGSSECEGGRLEPPLLLCFSDRQAHALVCCASLACP